MDIKVAKTDTKKAVDSVKTDENKTSRKPSKKVLVTTLGIILLIAAIGTSVYFYKQYQDVKNNPTAAINEKNTQETQKVLNEVKGVILIESTETPTVARVENPETLKKNNETFYKNVQKGDYLILYKDRAIIYRESNNQIINVAPIINTADLQKKQTEQSKQTPATNR